MSAETVAAAVLAFIAGLLLQRATRLLRDLFGTGQAENKTTRARPPEDIGDAGTGDSRILVFHLARARQRREDG